MRNNEYREFYTDYARDAYGRLTSFDIKEIGGTRILKHEWAYDSMGRKSAAAGITVSGSGLPTPISFSYDAASRVTQEALNGQWSVSYGYDTAGNRTSVNDGTIDKTIGYGVGNRETSVSGGIDPLGYDYKGNVISRMTLDGTKTYHYGWDAFDRLTSATQMWSGGATVGYDYDAMGRLLRRAKTDAAGTSTTLNYWLGLNKLAEERIVDDGSTAVVRPDSEASYPEANGWGFYDIGWDFTLQYDEDSVRGQVLTLAAIGGAASMIVGDDSGENYNPNATAWAAQGRRQLGFWFKNDDEAELQITVFGRASSGYGTLVFDTGTGTDYADSGNGCYVYYLGNSGRFPTMNDGNWHYIELDLGAYQPQFSGVAGALTHVDGLAFTLPEDCQIQLDDIILSAGALERSYGLIPGAKISGYLGAQTGSTGAKDVNTQTQCVDPWSRYYYHFSDLGTVMATSTVNGGTLGAYEPDFYGNFKYLSGYRPDSLGMTGKFYDSDIALYIFKYRMYDSQRGRWASRDPLGQYGGINLYEYVENDAINSLDIAGLIKIYGNWCGPDWTGGHREQYTPHAPGYYTDPIDELDAACKEHDMCYYTCRQKHPCSCGERSNCFKGCDSRLSAAAHKFGDFYGAKAAAELGMLYLGYAIGMTIDLRQLENYLEDANRSAGGKAVGLGMDAPHSRDEPNDPKCPHDNMSYDIHSDPLGIPIGGGLVYSDPESYIIN